MVHHDFALGRLTLGSRQLAAMTAAGLKEVPFKDTADRMMTLGELCDLVAGRTPLVIELKSRFDGDLRLVARTADVLQSYAGPGRRDVVRSGPSSQALREIAPACRAASWRSATTRTTEWRAADARARSVRSRSCCTPSARGRISSPTT